MLSRYWLRAWLALMVSAWLCLIPSKAPDAYWHRSSRVSNGGQRERGCVGEGEPGWQWRGPSLTWPSLSGALAETAALRRKGKKTHTQHNQGDGNDNRLCCSKPETTLFPFPQKLEASSHNSRSYSQWQWVLFGVVVERTSQRHQRKVPREAR